MKTANVLEVRDVTSKGTHDSSRLGDKAKREHIEKLLRKYPDTKASETAEIRHFLATGSHMDVGLVAGSDEFAEKVRSFKRDHHGDFKLKAQEVALFVLVVLGPVAAMLWRYLH